jgi:hypothetical protein
MQHFGKEFVCESKQCLFHSDQCRLVIAWVESGDVWPRAILSVGKQSTVGTKHNTGSRFKKLRYLECAREKIKYINFGGK